MSLKQSHGCKGLPPGQKRLSFGGVPGIKRQKPDLEQSLQQHRDASGSSYAQCPVCGKQVPLLCINLHLDTGCADGAAKGGAVAEADGSRRRTTASTAQGVRELEQRRTLGQRSEPSSAPSANTAVGLTADVHKHRQQQLLQQPQNMHEDGQQQRQWQQRQTELQRDAALLTVETAHQAQALATGAEPHGPWPAPPDARADDSSRSVVRLEMGAPQSCPHSAMAAISSEPPSTRGADTAGTTSGNCGGGAGDGRGSVSADDGSGDQGGAVGAGRNVRRQGLGLASPLLHPMFLSSDCRRGNGEAGQPLRERAGRPAAAAEADLADSACEGGGQGGPGKWWWRQVGAAPRATPRCAARKGKTGAGEGQRELGGSGGEVASTTMGRGAAFGEGGLPMFQPVPHPSLDGQYVVSEFVTPEEEAELLALCDDPALKPPWSSWSGVSYANATAQKTRGKRWGVLPDYHRRGVALMEHPLPPLLRLLAERMSARVGPLRSFFPNEANAIDYRRSRGSWLRPHVDDRILSGDLIVNLCLAGAAVMSFARDKDTSGEPVRVVLPARSLQILSRAARYSYTHAIAPADLLDERRVSITFRHSELRPFERPA